MVGHDALSGPPVAQLPGAAGAGVVLTYCLTSLAFSPLESLMQRSPRPPQAVIDAKAHDLGLDRPILARYANWVSHAVRGDFGTTITGQPVGTELGRRIESACGCWSLDRYSARWPVW